MWVYNHTYSNDLYHHGVLGMKWGVRRTPEQLGRNTTSTERTKSKHQLKLEDRYINKKGMNQEDAEKAAAKRAKVEKFLKVAAVITVAAATAYVVKKGIDLELLEQGREKQFKINETLDSIKKSGILNVSDIPTIKGDHSMLDDLKAVNPNYAKGKNKYTKNCAYCVTAFEMRRRGFDIEAVGNSDGMSTIGLGTIFKSPEVKTVNRSHPLSDIAKDVKTWGDGARGKVNVYKKDAEGVLTGHTFAFEVKNGRPNFVDPQTGSDSVLSHFSGNKKVEYMRLDNLEFTDEILKVVAKRGV